MAISFHSLKFSPKAASFSLTRPKKAQHSGPLKSFVLPRFKGKCCPVECLESYVAISGEWRDPDSSALFLSNRRPHKPVGSSTLGNWIKSCLSDAGLDPSSFSVHSTRGAAASKAVKQGIPVDTVLKTANWSRESTFQKFYHRVLVGTTVTEAVFKVSYLN
jgi:site-specific recombinase XerD